MASPGPKGYALVTVLMMSLAMVTTVLAVTLAVRQRTGVMGDLRDRAEASVRAYGGLNRVLFRLLTGTLVREGLQVSVSEDRYVVWPLQGSPVAVAEGVEAKLTDTSGSISPLTEPGSLERLLAGQTGDVQRAQAMMDCLQDWQDRDELRRLNGAEADEYRLRGREYGPRNFYVQVVDELKLLQGFTPEIVESLRPRLVLWKEAGGFGVETTDSERSGKHPQDKPPPPSPSPSVGRIKVEVEARVGEVADRISCVVWRHETSIAPFEVEEWRR